MLFRILVAQIIHPVNNNNILRFSPFQQKSKIRVFGNALPHIAGGNGFVVVLNGQYLDEMGRDKLIGCFILVATVFHGM